VNTFHCDQGTGSTFGAALQAFYTAIKGESISALTWTFDGTVPVIDVATGNITGMTSQPSWSVVCSGGVSMLSPASQGLVQWRTGNYSNGRELRGRTFLPAVPSTRNTNGAPSSTYLTNVGTAATALESTAMVIYSTAHRAIADVAVGGAGVWEKWAVLRSRRD